MNTVLLVITFFVIETGEQVFIDGWGPRVQPSMEVCESRKPKIEQYLDQIIVSYAALNAVVTCEEIR